MRVIKTYSPATRILSLILSLLIIFYVIPTSVFSLADEADTGEASESTFEPTNIEQFEAEPYEVVELREESVKHFRLSDGSYIAADYGTPVHYADENGEWQDIDNSLSDDGSEYSTGNAKIKFQKKITGNGSIFTLHEESSKITVSLIGAEKKTEGRITSTSDSDESADTKLGKLMNLENLSSSIIYEDILDGVDLEYIAHSENIKENIIIKEKKDVYTYSFTVELNNLSAALASDGCVYITNDENELVYLIPAPVLYDAAGEYAPYDASYFALTDGGNGKYVLTVTADSEWMNDGSRAYPVVLDPAFRGGFSDGVDVEISSDEPDSNYSSSFFSYVSSTSRMYWKLPTEKLPAVPSYGYITEVQLNIHAGASEGAVLYVGAYEVATDWDNTLTWNKTLAEVPEGQLTNNLLDYCKITDTNATHAIVITDLARDWYTGGDNFGICLKTIESSATGTATVFTSEYTASKDKMPRLTVSYVNAMGVEDYYSYSSHSAGVGVGSVNLANGNLTFASDLISTSDYLMPLTVSAVYNSGMSGKDYTVANSYSAYTSSYMPYGFKLNIGETVIAKKVSETETYYVLSDSDGTEHYFFPDEDEYVDDSALGRELTVTNNEIRIEYKDHSRKTFTKMSSSPAGTEGGWYLSKITDVSGNTVAIATDTSYRPSSVSLMPGGTNAIQQLTFAYNSQGKLKYVYNTTGTSTGTAAAVLRYSDTPDGEISSECGKYLRQITYIKAASQMTTAVMDAYYTSGTAPSGVSVVTSGSLSYNSTGQITEISSEQSAVSIRYEWQSGSVVKVSEYASAALGQEQSFCYGDGYSTIRSTGRDDVLGNSDDIITSYSFDKHARAVSVYSCSANGTEIYGATTGTYETQENVKNNIQKQVTVGGSAVNYIMNGGFESGTNHWTLSGAVSADTELSFEGEGIRCLEFAPTVSQAASAKQKLSLRAGEYTLSMLVNSADCENINGTVKIINVGTSDDIHTEEIPLSVIANVGKVSYFTTSFEVSSTSARLTVDVMIEFTAAQDASDAVIQIDRVMLTNSIGAADYSLVSYGAFDETLIRSDSTAYALTNVWSSTDLIISETDEPFGNVLRINGGLTSSSKVTQRVFDAPASDLNAFDMSYNNESGNHYGHDYIVSGFAKAVSDLVSYSGNFGIVVDVAYYQGEGKSDVVVSHTFDFVPSCSGWQFVCGHVPTKYESTGEVKYNCIRYISVTCDFSNQIDGYALFDNISLIYATGDNLARNYYNEDGLIKAKESYDYKEYYHYNDDNNLYKVLNSENKLLEYTYDTVNTSLVNSIIEYSFTWKDSDADNDYLSTSIDSLINKTPISKTEYTYDYSYGLCLATSVYRYSSSGQQSSTHMKEEYRYVTSTGSKIFGAISYSKDYNNVATTYLYDESDGRLLLTACSDGTATSYSYDEKGFLEEVSPATYSGGTITVSDSSDVQYSYNSYNLLESITTDSTEYTLSYNSFGVQSSVEIGDKTLAEYEYNERNGKLKSITYGGEGGFCVDYVYDELDNLSEVWYTPKNKTRTLVYEYEYTSYGQLAKLVDHTTGRTSVYRYDINGRVIMSGQHEDGEYDLSTEYTYDELNRLSREITRIFYNDGTDRDTKYISYSYTYNDDDSLTELSAAGLTMEYTYDELKRLEGTYYHSTGGFSFVESYTFVEYYSSASSAYVATPLVSTYSISGGNEYEYRYDERGNIIEEIINWEYDYPVYYEYDDLGQLLSVDDCYRQMAYFYTYDSAGNITSAEMTAAELDGFYNTYGYTDSQWGDLLTSFNGVTITYDDIGNPTSYYNGTSYSFTWEGRRLVGATSAGKTYSFTYNDDGIRTSKTVNGVEHKYYLSGDRIIAEEWDGDMLIYVYDATGSPIGMMYYMGYFSTSFCEKYWFEKNIWGDITGVYDDAGNLIIEYSYDPYGNCTETVLSNSYGAYYNPFRYRGYYYDADLGLYYLQSRYYDAKICRFINADGQLNTDSLIGCNLFAYCYNNPIMYTDHTGRAPNWDMLFMGVLLTGIGVLTVAATVATGGSCIPLVAAGYAVLATAGITTTAVGVSEVYESFTDENPLRDSIGEVNYDILKYGSLTVISMGPAIIEYGTSVSVCFVAGTLIKAEKEDIRIENIKVGDYVYAHNPETGETELKPVVNTFVNEATELVHVFTEGEEIVCTKEHPFYSPVKGWVAACKLRAGDILVSLNGEYIVVEQVQHEILEAPIKVYNFEVEDFHTYFVGDGDGVLVHNDCESYSSRGVGGKGWVGDKTWRSNVSTIGKGGTITSLNGGVPTKSEAIQLINEAGGTVTRIEGPHQFPNPHDFSHINYLTSEGIKGTIKIFE